MEEPALTQEIVTFMSVAGLVSFAAGIFLFQRHVGDKPLLAYEPRRRSPWGALVLVIPVCVLLLAFAQLFSESSSLDETTQSGFVDTALDFALIQIGYVAFALLWLQYDKGADHLDLGLPGSVAQLLSDLAIGIVACVAALLPVFVVNFSLILAFQVQQRHPMVERLLESNSTGMLSAAFVAAVIAAPIFEEFVFRLQLQGWLERLEDESLRFQATARDAASEDNLQDSIVLRPQSGWLGILPHGWLPIVISSVLFGLAHLGHGVAPIPLVLFGIVLGYLYQRTHRILPCIVAHMLFNGYSMVLLWLGLDALGK